MLLGTPTEETLDLMSQDRCGVPDITTDGLRVSRTRRKKRYALHGLLHLIAPEHVDSFL